LTPLPYEDIFNVLSNAEDEGELFVTFGASVFVTGHLLSLLSLLEWDFLNYLPITDNKTNGY
jgi:hypothetical protein